MSRKTRTLTGLRAPLVGYEEKVVDLPPSGWNYFDTPCFRIMFYFGASLRCRIVTTKTREFILESSDALVVPCPCQQLIQGLKPGRDRSYTISSIFLDPKLMSHPVKAFEESANNPPIPLESIYFRRFIEQHLSRLQHFPKAAKTEIGSLIRQLNQEADHRPLGFRIRASSLIEAMLVKLVRDGPFHTALRDQSSDSKVVEPLIEHLQTFLADNFRLPISLSEIARSLNKSENYLSVRYKRATGRTIFQDLATLRINHARRLLMETEMTAREVGKLSGYPDPVIFSRAFKRHTGKSPLEFRKWGTEKTEWFPSKVWIDESVD